MSNLTPNKIFKGRNPDGSKFRIEEWDFADVATMDAISFVFYLCLGCVASAFIPIVLTVMAIYNYNGRAKVFYVITALISAYFIYDANHGWLVTMFLTWFFEESTINVLISLITTCLVLNLVFLFIGKLIYGIIESISGEVSARWSIFMGLVLIISVLTYNVTKSHYKHQKGWVERNIDEGLEFSKSKSE
jgi:hypothetical protein